MSSRNSKINEAKSAGYGESVIDTSRSKVSILSAMTSRVLLQEKEHLNNPKPNLKSFASTSNLHSIATNPLLNYNTTTTSLRN